MFASYFTNKEKHDSAPKKVARVQPTDNHLMSRRSEDGNILKDILADTDSPRPYMNAMEAPSPPPARRDHHREVEQVAWANDGSYPRDRSPRIIYRGEPTVPRARNYRHSYGYYEDQKYREYPDELRLREGPYPEGQYRDGLYRGGSFHEDTYRGEAYREDPSGYRSQSPSDLRSHLSRESTTHHRLYNSQESFPYPADPYYSDVNYPVAEYDYRSHSQSRHGGYPYERKAAYPDPNPIQSQSQAGLSRPKSRSPPITGQPERLVVRTVRRKSLSPVEPVEEGEVSHGVSPLLMPESTIKLPSSTKTTKFAPIVFDLKTDTNFTPLDNTRYFVARCNSYHFLAMARRETFWRAPHYIVNRIERALQDGVRICLAFSLHGSLYWQGLAQLDTSRSILHPPHTDTSPADKLIRVPLIWLHQSDVPFASAPHIPGLKSPEDPHGIKESFEIPSDLGRQLEAAFERSSLDGKK